MSTRFNWQPIAIWRQVACQHWMGLHRRIRQWRLGIMIICLAGFLTACNLPQVSAEDRLFLNLSVDFLGAYQLPTTEFAGTRLGGLSALTYDRQRDRIYALSDDRSEFAPARFYTLKLELDTSQPDTVRLQQVNVEKVTILKGEDGNPLAKGTLDPEGMVLSPLRSLFVSSEGVASQGILPFVREFDLETGQWQRNLPIPERYNPLTTDQQPSQGVQDNLGLEALTVSPGGYGNTEVEPFRIFTATESALVQDADPSDSEQGAKSRLLHYMVEKGRSLLISEHLYLLDPLPEGANMSGLVELAAIDQGGHFLSLERSFGLTAGFGAKLFQLASGSATDTSTIASLKGDLKGVEPIRKKLLLDLSDLDIDLDNLEGMTFGPRLPDGSQSLLLVSDDNFRDQQVTQFLLFRLVGKA